MQHPAIGCKTKENREATGTVYSSETSIVTTESKGYLTLNYGNYSDNAGKNIDKNQKRVKM